MTIRLRCVSRYRNIGTGQFYEAGDEFVADQVVADLLRRDSPGSFEVVEEEAVSLTSLDGPPADKMVRRERAARRKSERGAETVMSRENMPGIVRPKG